MRSTVTTVVSALPLPTLDERSAAALADDPGAHDRFLERWPCMSAVEVVDAPTPVACETRRIAVAAWNLERCKHVEAGAAILAERRVDVVLATEMDLGCARSGQRHTTADLAAQLGLGHVYGVEFVELGLGDVRETEIHAGEVNRAGLHGNAVLSRFPIRSAALIPLDDGGLWYASAEKPDQKRIGGRNAIAAVLAASFGEFVAVSVHLESLSDSDLRRRQMEHLLAEVDRIAGNRPVVLGGDLNVFELSRRGLDDAAMMTCPESVEPAFAVARAHGYAWAEANRPGTTTRRHPWQSAAGPLLRIDWLFVRGFAASDPWIEPALAPDGAIVSDHDAIGTIVMPV
ncbi:MAG: endonuclease/exonuclease/phosphatase family protein [Phyllobacteriaceae bacterium]|nr:endonuclease/exonuclease/phosphatase family protein [Phyllobacteriaceae bacterium]